MSKCQKCEISVEYLENYCLKCRKKLAGIKPKKSKKLCIGCTNNWYNHNRENGCYAYNKAKIVIQYIYHSINQVIPNLKWKLKCFNQEY